MNHFGTYRDRFPNARLTRSDSGVLEMALHTNGGCAKLGVTFWSYLGSLARRRRAGSNLK